MPEPILLGTYALLVTQQRLRHGAIGYATVWSVGTANVVWNAGTRWQTILSRNNSTAEGNVWYGQRDFADANIIREFNSPGSAKVTLAGGDTLRIKAYHTRGANTNTVGYRGQEFFHIVRIA